MRKSNELGVRNFTIAYDFFLNARPSNAHGINAKPRLQPPPLPEADNVLSVFCEVDELPYTSSRGAAT